MIWLQVVLNFPLDSFVLFLCNFQPVILIPPVLELKYKYLHQQFHLK